MMLFGEPCSNHLLHGFLVDMLLRLSIYALSPYNIKYFLCIDADILPPCRLVITTAEVKLLLIVWTKFSLKNSYCAIFVFFKGSKGGVGVRISIHDASLCFINTHLAAHDEKVERRNEVCYYIL